MKSSFESPKENNNQHDENLDLFKDQQKNTEQSDEKDIREILERLSPEAVKAFDEEQERGTVGAEVGKWFKPTVREQVGDVWVEIDPVKSVARGTERGVDPSDPEYTIIVAYNEDGDIVTHSVSGKPNSAVIKRIYSAVGKRINRVVRKHPDTGHPGESHD